MLKRSFHFHASPVFLGNTSVVVINIQVKRILRLRAEQTFFKISLIDIWLKLPLPDLKYADRLTFLHYKFRFIHFQCLLSQSLSSIWKQLCSLHTELLPNKYNTCHINKVKRKFGTWKTLTFSSIFFFSSLDLFEICFRNSLSCNSLFSATAIFLSSSSRWGADLSETWGCSDALSYCGCFQKEREQSYKWTHTYHCIL